MMENFQIDYLELFHSCWVTITIWWEGHPLSHRRLRTAADTLIIKMEQQLVMSKLLSEIIVRTKFFFNHNVFLRKLSRECLFKWLGAVQDKAWSGCLSPGGPTLGCLGIRRHLLAAAFLRWLHNNSCCTLLCPTSPSCPQNYLSKPDRRQNECKTTRVRPVESLLTLEKTDLDGDYVVSLHTLV